MGFTSPIDWKSEMWWRNRPPAERVFHAHIRKHMESLMDKKPAHAEFVQSWTPCSNLIIQGPHGSGKSLMAASTLVATVTTHPISGRWLEADEYISMLKDSFDNDGLLPEMWSSPHLIKYVQGVFDLVVIDALGEERTTEFAIHELGNLIRTRFDREKSTIITTKLSMQDIKMKYGARLATSLSEFTLVSPNGA